MSGEIPRGVTHMVESLSIQSEKMKTGASLQDVKRKSTALQKEKERKEKEGKESRQPFRRPDSGVMGAMPVSHKMASQKPQGLGQTMETRGPTQLQPLKKVSCLLAKACLQNTCKVLKCDRHKANNQAKVMKRMGATWSYIRSEKKRNWNQTFLPYPSCTYCEMEDYFQSKECFEYEPLMDFFNGGEEGIYPIPMSGLPVKEDARRITSWDPKSIVFHSSPILARHVIEGLLFMEGASTSLDNQTLVENKMKDKVPYCHHGTETAMLDFFLKVFEKGVDKKAKGQLPNPFARPKWIPNSPRITKTQKKKLKTQVDFHAWYKTQFEGMLHDWWPTTTFVAVSVQTRPQNEMKARQFNLPIVMYHMESIPFSMSPIVTQTIVWACLERVLRCLCWVNRYVKSSTPTTDTLYPGVHHFLQLFRDSQCDFWTDSLALDTEGVILDALQKIVWAYVSRSTLHYACPKEETKQVQTRILLFYQQQKERIWKQCIALHPHHSLLVKANLILPEQPYSQTQIETRINCALDPCAVWLRPLLRFCVPSEARKNLLLYIKQETQEETIATPKSSSSSSSPPPTKTPSIMFPMPKLVRWSMQGKLIPSKSGQRSSWKKVHDVLLVRQHGYVLLDHYYYRAKNVLKNKDTPWILLPSFQKTEWKHLDQVDVDDCLQQWVSCIPKLSDQFFDLTVQPKCATLLSVTERPSQEATITMLQQPETKCEIKTMAVGADQPWIPGLIRCFLSRAWARLTVARGVIALDARDDAKLFAYQRKKSSESTLDMDDILDQLQLAFAHRSETNATTWGTDAIATCHMGKSDQTATICLRDNVASMWDLEKAHHAAPLQRPSYETTLPTLFYKWLTQKNTTSQQPLFMRGMLIQ